MIRFILVIAILIGLTAFKIAQLFPEHEDLAALSTVPLFLLMLAGPILSRAGKLTHGSLLYRTLAWAGSITMALWSTFIFLSIPIDLISLLINQFVPVPWLWIQRIVLAVSCLAVFLGMVEVLRGPIVRQLEVLIEDLPPALDNLKIIQISDLHVGPTIRKSYVADVVEKVNQHSPDFVFATGDMADAKGEAIVGDLSPMKDMRSRHGTFYVTGNHEYYNGVDGIVREVARLGWTPLINENRTIHHESIRILVVGITDPMGITHRQEHHPSVERASITTSQTDFKILLAHRPDAYKEAHQHGFDLQLSGHTHSGQYFPFNLMIGFFHRYSRGLHKHHETWVHVNPGTGYWGPPNRLGVPAEITLLTLKKPKR